MPVSFLKIIVKNTLVMSIKYNDFESIMRDLYRISFIESPKVFIATDYDFDDYAYLKQKLDELFWFTDTFQLPIRVLADATYGVDTHVIKYADEYKLTKILYNTNSDKIQRLSELRLSEFLKYEEILSIATHFILFADDCSSDMKCLIDKARERNMPAWVFDKRSKE